jgi:undecaprenyl pyrophosphate phosphatase UppP
MSWLWFWLMKSVAEFLFAIVLIALMLVVGVVGMAWSEYRDEKAKREREKS